MTGRHARPDPPVDGPRRRPARIDVRDWLGGIRLSGFMVIMLGLVVLAVLVLVPTVGTYLDQRQRIAALAESVRVTEQQVEDLSAQERRFTDPAYITTQARERLYYVTPGDVVYLVDNDLPAARQPRDAEQVSDQLEQTPTDWMAQLVRSVAAAGAARTAVAPEPGPLP